MTYREDKPHLRAFEPGNSRNTVLRLVAEVLGIPLVTKQPARDMQGQNAGARQFATVRPDYPFADYDTDERQPPIQYAQTAPKTGRLVPTRRWPTDLEKELVEMGLSSLSPAPQRSFKEDFPDGYKADPKTGRMMTDVDGRPINPQAVIVGRAFENQNDIPLSNVDGDNIIEQLTGKDIEYGIFPDRRGGVYNTYSEFQSEPGTVRLNTAFRPEVRQRIKRHELGHVIDHIGGRSLDHLTAIPLGVRKDFFSIYNEQKNPAYNQERLYNPDLRPENVPKGTGFKPLDDGYENEIHKLETETGDVYKFIDIERGELFAEAVYAYLTNPNAMKARYPAAAQYLRDFINTHPDINKYLHLSFNGKTPYYSIAEQKKNT